MIEPEKSFFCSSVCEKIKPTCCRLTLEKSLCIVTWQTTLANAEVEDGHWSWKLMAARYIWHHWRTLSLLRIKGGCQKVVVVQTLVRGFENLFQFCLCSGPFTTIPTSGETTTSSTFQEERLGLTHKRLSYRPTGKHPSPRSALKYGQQIRYIVINKQADSLYSLIADGQHRATSLSREKWKSLIGPEGSLQAHCNTQGFNAVGSNSGMAKARIGIVANQENDCNTCDSRIGFGTGGQFDDSNTCGNQATHSPDNGNKHIKAFGYILVQWEERPPRL